VAYFPFFVDLEGKKCLIAGGGRVAYRKASVLLEYGPQIIVVSPHMLPELEQLGEKKKEELMLKYRKFEGHDLTDMDVVIAATSDKELNQRIFLLCRQQNIPVNVVDNKEACSFLFPALIKDEEIVVGISTGGNAPTIARYLKKIWKQVIPHGIGSLAKQLGTYRDMVKEKVADEAIRRAIFQAMLLEGIQLGGSLSRERAEELIEREQVKHDESNHSHRNEKKYIGNRSDKTGSAGVKSSSK
jgi:siroheme synthase-like protein